MSIYPTAYYRLFFGYFLGDVLECSEISLVKKVIVVCLADGLQLHRFLAKSPSTIAMHRLYIRRGFTTSLLEASPQLSKLFQQLSRKNHLAAGADVY